ncbi:hypothetical protein OC842_000712 [Tilletia horrida]|uniref:Uncharacterized protein n=1 Tax=Tilletia horrida TaxID=155126 RepID=A0AAN6GHP6_9BASI|nr:hypothetical protein OC842_000712 [Tilletia horrida]
MDPLDADSSSFTWSALNADSDIFSDGPGGGGSSSGSGGGGVVKPGGNNPASGSGSSSQGRQPEGGSPLQIPPAPTSVPVPSPQPTIVNRPSGFVTVVTTRTFALPTAIVSASSSTSAPAPSLKPAPSTSTLPPSAIASISSALASVAASSLSASLATPSIHAGPLKNITTDASAGDNDAPVPLRRNAPLLLLLVLGCLVGAATIMASLAWLCRVTDSRKRAKKKARLNQASWDPDASSSVFDGAGSSVLGSSLLGGTAGGHLGPPLAPAEHGATTSSSWWVLGDGSKRTASPSLMEYEYDTKDEKYEAERDNESAIFMDGVVPEPVSVCVPAAAAFEPDSHRHGASTRQHRRPGSILSGLGVGARPLPSLGFGSRFSRQPAAPAGPTITQRHVSAQSQYTLPPLAFQDFSDVGAEAAPPPPPKRMSAGLGSSERQHAVSRRDSKKISSEVSAYTHSSRTGSMRYSAGASRRSTNFGPNPHLDIIAATPSLVGGHGGEDTGTVIEYHERERGADPYTSLPASRNTYRHSYGQAPAAPLAPLTAAAAASGDNRSHPNSRQSSWEREMRLHGHSPLRPPVAQHPHGGAGGGGRREPSAGALAAAHSGSRNAIYAGSGVPSSFLDPFARCGTPRIDGGGGGGGGLGAAGPPDIARVSTPVLSPLLNQLMHGGGPPDLGMARPGTPSSLLAGRGGRRAFGT